MKTPLPVFNSALFGLVMLIVTLTSSLAIYLPGAGSAFLFDDKANILANNFLRLETLKFSDLKRAALSGSSGPLKRPVASLSFSLNYYFSDGQFKARTFKITNAVIHGINGFLLFLFTAFLINNLTRSESTSPGFYFPGKLAAATISLFWLVHPVQLTSVLYPVQRMTSLAATFTLLCLLTYIHLRSNWSVRSSIAWRAGMGLGAACFFLLAILTKEIALITPLLILMIEAFCFPDSPLLKSFHALKQNKLVAAILAIFLLVATYLVILYANSGYGSRSFSMSERLLTEPRVLIFYLSLILVPRPNAFALHHDDIAISTGILTPWSTLPAILGIASMLILAYIVRKKAPMISFGLLWFLTGHLLESTFFALDIAYEHRNYLPSFGIILAIAGLIKLLLRNHKKSVLVLAIPVIFVSLASLSMLRSNKWANPASMVYFQVKHHPDSARTHAEWAGILESAKQFEEAKQHYLFASNIEPDMPAYLIWHQLLVARQGNFPEHSIDNDILERLKRWGARPSTILALADVSDCVVQGCSKLGESFAQWLDVLISTEEDKSRLSFYYQMKGLYLASIHKPFEAVEAYTQAYNLNRRNLTALISLAWIFINTNQKQAAQYVFTLLKDSQDATGLPKEAEMSEIEKRIQQLK